LRRAVRGLAKSSEPHLHPNGVCLCALWRGKRLASQRIHREGTTRVPPHAAQCICETPPAPQCARHCNRKGDHCWPTSHKDFPYKHARQARFVGWLRRCCRLCSSRALADWRQGGGWEAQIAVAQHRGCTGERHHSAAPKTGWRAAHTSKRHRKQYELVLLEVMRSDRSPGKAAKPSPLLSTCTRGAQ
jgi:hypothetical protein